MQTLNIRGIDEALYERIKTKSRETGVSMNKLVRNALSNVFGEKKPAEYHDLDDFFGTWTEQDFSLVNQAENDSRAIDEELWK